MSLNKKILVIFSVASLTMLFFILPAEYGIDPTGVGQKIGISNLNRVVTENDVENANTIKMKGSILIYRRNLIHGIQIH